ncbi:MAG TPA: translational GTPase TypA [Acidiferrobacter sp.]|nr:translational GTPase TypA [Acidiferrobacter sp.]
MTTQNLRNIAIIAHVDHGKTTLVDELLKQSGTFESRATVSSRMMDSNDLERERGITILAKNTAIRWRDHRINIVDTPGHADFGGEVERVLSMVDSVLLLVDAVDGPMPQTRFVTRKAFALGLRPIVVINKVDRPGARLSWVLDQTFDLFDKLGATEEQLDFPVVYTSALYGYSSLSPDAREGDMTPLFEAILRHTPPPKVDPDGPFQMQVSSLAYSSYVGPIATGRITRGTVRPNQIVAIVDRDGKRREGKVLQVLGFLGLERTEVKEASAGDIIAVAGIDPVRISDTLCDPILVEALTPLTVDEPTVTMTFEINTSPFVGQDGKFVTSRQLRERLDRELIHNVALRVEDTADADKFKVSGRGELHLGILIETMRREGYELAVSRPQVITKMVDGEMHEPYELLTLDVEQAHQGVLIERLGSRRGDLLGMDPDAVGRVRLEYVIPSRGLIGFQTEFLSLTSGTGLMHHVYDHYAPVKKGSMGGRINGVLIANGAGKSVAYALFSLQERGRLFIGPGEDIYEGMIIGIHSRDNDLVVNPLRGKQLTNMRASGSDEAVLLTPPIQLTLERAIEFIDDDELVEVTPHHVRVRKRYLKENDRKRSQRSG